ncbi:MAG: AAA family ATPase [Verrucomicrobiota bacterium]
MKSIRIFISSPGDVHAERALTKSVIQRVASELQLPVDIRYSILLDWHPEDSDEATNKKPDSSNEELVLCPYFWELQRFHLDEGYQEQIPRTDRFDLVVCILWNRLGSKLNANFQNPDGTEPLSGTEYEVQWARHRRQLLRKSNPGLSPNEILPALHVYRNRSKTNPPDDPDEGLEFYSQRKALISFVEDWERAGDGSFKGAFNSYDHLGEFERKFEDDLRDFLGRYVSENRPKPKEGPPPLWNRKELGSPFRRLDVYECEHASVFCGRSRILGETIHTLAQQANSGTPLVLLIGASGSGKSSLARAGVLPIVQEEEVIEGVKTWKHASFRPGDRRYQANPCRSLAAALLEETALPGLRDLELDNPDAQLEKLFNDIVSAPEGLVFRIEDQLNQIAREDFEAKKSKLEADRERHETEGRLGDVAEAKARLDGLTPSKARLILLVDQLEELFESENKTSEKSDVSFVGAFLRAIDRITRSGRVFVLMTLRSDFYDEFQKLPDLVSLVGSDGIVNVLPPDPTEIGQIIRQPASSSGLHYSKNPETGKSLDEELRDQAIQSPECLPLLSHLLDLLVELESKRDDGELSWKDYEELGGIGGALSTHADRVYKEHLSESDEPIFHQVLSGLVRIGVGDKGEEVALRKEARLQDLIEDADGKISKQASRLIDAFSGEDARLFIKRGSSDIPGEVYVTITHEVLIRKWDRIRKWVSDNSSFLRRRDRIDAMRQQYAEAVGKLEQNANDPDHPQPATGSPDDYLLPPGLPLTEGRSLIEEKERTVSRELRSYIEKSISAFEERDRRRKKRRRLALVAISVLVLSFLCTAAFLRIENVKKSAAEDQAAQERLRQKAYFSLHRGSERLDEGDATGAIKHYADAMSVFPDFTTRSSMLEGLLVLPDYLSRVYSRAASPIRHLEFSDGGRLLAATADGEVILIPSIVEDASGKIPSPLVFQSSRLLELQSQEGGWTGWTEGANEIALSKESDFSANRPETNEFEFRHLSSDEELVAKVSFQNGRKLLWGRESDRSDENSHEFPRNISRIKTSAASGIAVALEDNSIWVQEEGGSRTEIFPPSSAAVLAITFGQRQGSPVIITGDSNGVVRWLNLEPEGRTFPTVQLNGRVLALSQSTASGNLAIGTSDGELIVIHEEEERLRDQNFRLHSEAILSISWTEDGNFFASGGNDGRIGIWHYPKREGPVFVMKTSLPLRATTALHDEKLLALGSADGSIHLWDPNKSASVESIEGTGPITSLDWSAERESLVAGRFQNGLRIIRFESFSPLKVAEVNDIKARQENDTIHQVKWSPEENKIAATSDSGEVLCYDETYEEPDLIGSFTEIALGIAWSPDGNQIVAGSARGEIQSWEEGKDGVWYPKHKFEGPGGTFAHKSSVSNLDWSSCGKFFASCSNDGTIKIWNAESGVLLESSSQVDGYMEDIRILDEQNYLATCDNNGYLRLWKLPNLEPVFAARIEKGHARSLVADSSNILTGFESGQVSSIDYNADNWLERAQNLLVPIPNIRPSQ